MSCKSYLYSKLQLIFFVFGLLTCTVCFSRGQSPGESRVQEELFNEAAANLQYVPFW